MNINNIQLGGRLTADPEIRYTAQGTAVCSVAIAINRQKGEEKVTTFVDVTFWQQQAELVAKFCRKGGRIYVEGMLVQERWTDKSTGKARSKLAVAGRRAHFIDWANDEPQAKREDGYQREPQPHHSEIDPGEGDDIPF